MSVPRNLKSLFLLFVRLRFDSLVTISAAPRLAGSNQVTNLDLKTSTFNKAMLNPASKSADGLKPESTLSPITPRSPRSSPSSPRSIRDEPTIRPVTSRSRTRSMNAPLSPNEPEPPTPSFTAMPQYPPSPKDNAKHNRDPSRSFFANLKASRSSHKITNSDSSGLSAEPPSKSRGSSRDRSYPMLRRNGSTPDLLEAASRQDKERSEGFQNEQSSRQGMSDIRNGAEQQARGPPQKKSKPRFGNLLSRTRSVRVDDKSAPRSAGLRRPSNATLLKVSESQEEISGPPRTAPMRSDKDTYETSNSNANNRPPDRPVEGRPQTSRREKNPSLAPSSSFMQVSGASTFLFNNIKHTSSGAADRLGKAGKGFFGKITRSGSTNEREVVLDDNYVCTVINLPLVEQTRKTRISKRLEDCKDKTEYWMPALPYRCIDYLNYKGCEEEGLYRVPGSGKEVKHWQRRFDTEGDINLFDEPDLYDINTIGSMFKAWLRELPDELLPKATQQMIAEKCEGATTAPQLLKDELSKLPPYNYYLLFAITCHLNLLHSYVEQNKMNYQNLCICFQPCMKIDGFCFQFLVCDWKNCWQGCWTEKEWVQDEKEAQERAAKEAQETKPNGKPTNTTNGRNGTTIPDFSQRRTDFPESSSAAEERAISSSGSSQPDHDQPIPNPAATARKTRPANLEDTKNHRQSMSQLPELGPPLSPIKI
ncbi:Rho GTPase activator (Bem2), putative [Talaromyces stipitatus ATCC 10500]|uniref:Rho GTPase activator (Bem2), putative n=1 Tax=Talaromyces stipitatus (strain ATCC 10500 / CBS 375.48 / QM 6759 / NRRL 1006) TaxID=441959 RepID=B8MAX6_TALSN|nr:Rho GTPase activator (Bem2), putative [Talaromyces stipitatus ATCC 10500]EED18677.1 Rho GTPase activator (Bem2), putative [Talaromyces stipitatus ATCC 10500]